MPNIEQRVKKAICNITLGDETSIDAKLSLSDYMDVSSSDIMDDFIAALVDEFKIQISAKEVAKFATINGLIGCIETKIPK